MTAPLYDLVVAPVAADLLACLMTEMAKVPDPPASVCVRVGSRTDLLIAETYDECCAGLAWVRFADQYPSRDFPEPDGDVSPCGVARWALVFELGAARCAPVGDATSVPSCDAWTAAAVHHYADLAALRRTACCYENDHRGQRKILVNNGGPGATEGGCTIVTMQIIVSALACDPVCKGSVT